MLAVKGNAICDIQLVSGETGIIYSTKNFVINIDETAVDNSVIESTYEFDALNNIISTNEKLKKWYKDLDARITDIELAITDYDDTEIHIGIEQIINGGE